MGNVPIMQVLLTIQFRPAFSALHALQIAALYELFSGEFPSFGQVNPAGPMPINFDQMAGLEPVETAVPTMPRFQLESSDSTRLIMFQQDRFSFGWTRRSSLDEDAAYPGFDTLMPDLLRYYSIFRDWLSVNLDFKTQTLAMEIAYTNALRLNDDNGDNRRLSSIFTFLNPSLPPVQTRGYDFSWNEEIEGGGIMTMRASGPIATLHNIPAVLLQLTASFATPGLDDAGTMKAASVAHAHALKTFSFVVRPDRLATY